MNNCEQLIRPALSTILDEFEIRQDQNSCLVVTPFQHTDGDLIRLWIESDQGPYYQIRDYGETFAMLRLYGVDPESSSRSERVDEVIERFSLQPDAGEIFARAHEDDLGIRLLETLQAVQGMSYLIYTHQKGQPTRFRTQVEGYLQEVGYSYNQSFEVSGHTHDRVFDLAINHRAPKVLLDTIHSSNVSYLGQQVDKVLVNWYEIQDMKYSHGVVVDDVDGETDESQLKTLKDNLDYYFSWSDKRQIEEEIPLTAP